MHVCVHVDVYAYVFTCVCMNGYILHVCIFVCLSCTSLYYFPDGTGDVDSIPGSGISSRGGHGNPLQYSCLENLMDGGAWWATVHRVTKSQTRLSD